MTVEVVGLDKVIAKLEGLDDPDRFRIPMTQAVAHIHRRVVIYPPATAANVSPGINGYSWYVRGFGVRTVTGREYATSEQLQQNWVTEISIDGRQGKIGTNVSYAPYVQDRDKQASYHKQRGWITAQTIAENEAVAIAGYFDDAYKRYTQS